MSGTCRANRPGWGLLLTVSAIHCALIFGPLGYFFAKGKFSKPKEIAFRVRLGGDEPSHAPEIGPPERIRPSAGKPQPPAPEPSVQEPPAPQPPAPKVEPKTVPPAPKPVAKPKPVVKPKPKPVTKPKKEVKPKPKQTVKPKTKPTVKPDKTAKKTDTKKTGKKQTKPVKPAPSVYTDPRAKDFSPEHDFGGTNTNINVPIGSRDRGQALGPVDGRTPAGGATKEEEAYWNRLIPYFMERWTPPPGVLITEETAVTVELECDARGRITGKRIVSPSPNAAVTESVRRMLNALDYIPAPPSGAQKFALKLIPD